MQLTGSDILPVDWADATLVGRIWMPGAAGAGPRPVVLRNGELYDLSELAPTLSHLFDLPDPAAQVRAHTGRRLAPLEMTLLTGQLLAPCDLQAIKAAGVTFADSLIERVIEERSQGDASAAAALRDELAKVFGGTLAGLEPGSPAAMAAKAVLIRDGLWSQYLEVGIGPDAEVFTKAQPMSAVGCGAAIGLHPKSEWNNPEPEVVLAVSSAGAIVGATLGNDVNLRDFEGRSALLLSKAKDNNASCAIGPFVRLFDDGFGLDDVRSADVHLRVEGLDQFVVEGVNSMRRISRDPEALVAATIGPEHQYPDGLMLFLGTMFVPTRDRAGPGEGFTHREGDIVRVASPRLGGLINQVTTSDRAPPWTFGTRALMASLAARGLLVGPRGA
jgi:fumarylacetoacetate (FAA) hydrolase family protein